MLTSNYNAETGQMEFVSDGHVVLTPAHLTGHVEVGDGTRYNVTPNVIEVASPEHAAEVAHLIGQRVENEGHPGHDTDNPFVYTAPTEV